MLAFTEFRKASEAEVEALKTRGLTVSCGAPVFIHPRTARVLITDDHAYTFFFAGVEDKDTELLKTWKERAMEEFGDKAWLFAPEEHLLLTEDAVIRVFSQSENGREGHAAKINRITLPESFLPELETVKKIIRRAFFFLHAPNSESAEKYGLRFEYIDRNAEIITV